MVIPSFGPKSLDMQDHLRSLPLQGFGESVDVWKRVHWDFPLGSKVIMEKPLQLALWRISL